MKSILNIFLLTLVSLAIHACGSVPQQTASHIGNGEERFGSPTADNPFDQQAELTSSFGFSQSEPKSGQEINLSESGSADIEIILIPVSIHDGFSLSYSTLRFCRILFKQSCSHLVSQVRQPYGFPKAPVSLPDGADGSYDN